MRKASAILGTTLFLLVAPGVVAGVVPWWITQWHPHGSFPGVLLARLVGLALIVCGGLIILDSFARFALQGLGTPAPIYPTTHLVVTGAYRHVRNPMYVAVAAVIFGQALYFGSLQLLIYGALVWLAFQTFVLLYEEPKLSRTFGAEYSAFVQNVPRWIPRLRAWRG